MDRHRELVSAPLERPGGTTLTQVAHRKRAAQRDHLAHQIRMPAGQAAGVDPAQAPPDHRHRAANAPGQSLQRARQSRHDLRRRAYVTAEVPALHLIAQAPHESAKHRSRHVAGQKPWQHQNRMPVAAWCPGQPRHGKPEPSQVQRAAGRLGKQPPHRWRPGTPHSRLRDGGTLRINAWPEATQTQPLPVEAVMPRAGSVHLSRHAVWPSSSSISAGLEPLRIPGPTGPYPYTTQKLTRTLFRNQVCREAAAGLPGYLAGPRVRREGTTADPARQ
jgi:hypothetical protein